MGTTGIIQEIMVSAVHPAYVGIAASPDIFVETARYPHRQPEPL